MIRTTRHEDALEILKTALWVLPGHEAISALDSLTEDEITKAVREISADRQRMMILIAHRLSTIMYAYERR